MDYLEIDLRELIKRILPKWYWIAILALVLGAGAFVYSFTLPDIYEARATFAVTDPRYTANFDSRYATNNPAKPSESTIRSLVLNDEIAKTLFDLWESPDKADAKLASFKERLTVTLGDKGMTVTLTVQSKDPEHAAFLADAWAGLALAKVNEVFYGVNQDQVALFEQQLASTATDLETASEDLVTFAGQNELPVLRNELTSVLAAQAETGQKMRLLEAAILDLEGLAAQLETTPDDAPLDISLRISALLVQSRLYGSPVVTGVQTTHSDTYDITAANAGAGLQFDLAGLDGETTARAFEALLEGWLAVLDAQLLSLAEVYGTYPALVTTLQTRIQALENEKQRLNTDYGVQMSAYEIIAKKYEEVTLTMMDGEGEHARMVSQAVVPDERLPHNTVRNTAIGLVAGGFLGLAGVIVFDWWRMGTPKAQTSHKKDNLIQE